MARTLLDARPVTYVEDLERALADAAEVVARLPWGAVVRTPNGIVRLQKGVVLVDPACDAVEPEVAELLWRAEAAAGNAYAPYSGFRVGAAVLAGGALPEIFTGCNVENNSYGLTICAERVAVSTGVAAGVVARGGTFTHVGLFTATAQPRTPCGACRQFLSEMAPQAEVWCSCLSAEVKVFRVAELMPDPFQIST